MVIEGEHPKPSMADNTANHGGIYQQQVAPILEAAQQHLRRTGETHSQRGRPWGSFSSSSNNSTSRRPATSNNSSSAGSGMMRFVEGFVSPFVQCWQPPLNACAGMELRLPHHNNNNNNNSSSRYNYACGGDSSIAGYGADDVVVCGAMTTTRSHRGRSRMPSSTSRSPVPLQTTSTMVTPTASSVAPPHHRSRMYPRTTPTARHLPQVLAAVPVPPPTNTGSAAGQQLQHQPGATDVLCGRGGSSNRHNVHFRELVAANKAIYTTLTKKQKMLLSRKIVETIHHAGGRFLAKHATTGEWQDIGLPRSWEKASQALREKTSNASHHTTIIKGEEITEPGLEYGAADNHHNGSTNTSQQKVHPRLAEAPPLTIPDHLKEIYRAKASTVSSTVAVQMPAPGDSDTNNSSHPASWVADFADFSPRPDPTQSNYGYQHHHHPSDWAQSMPAPHRGAHPFSSRQMSRLGPKQTSNSPTITPSMVSPHHNHHHNNNNLHTPSAVSWQPSPSPTYTTNMAAVMTTPRHHSQNHGVRHPASPDPVYPNNQNGSINRHSSAQSVRGITTTAVTPVRPKSTYDDDQQPDQRGGRSPDMKRQRTHGEETRDEEDAILFDDPHCNDVTFSLQNASLTDGSHQLPAEVESKLSLQDKVISPSGMLQDRSAPRRPLAPNSPTTITSTSTHNDVSKRLNTSAEEEGLAGLVALSSATFLRMEES